MENAIVKVENVSMMFNMSQEKVDNIKEYIIKMMKHELMFHEFWALKNVSFQLEFFRNCWTKWFWKKYTFEAYCRSIKTYRR